MGAQEAESVFRDYLNLSMKSVFCFPTYKTTKKTSFAVLTIRRVAHAARPLGKTGDLCKYRAGQQVGSGCSFYVCFSV